MAQECEYGTIHVTNGSVTSFTSPAGTTSALANATLHTFLKKLEEVGLKPVGELPPYTTTGEYDIQVRRPKISEDAKRVLDKMVTGAKLVGDIGDYGRPFRLESPGVDSLDVPYSVVEELLKHGRIKVSADRGKGQVEYQMTRYQKSTQQTGRE